MNGMVSCEYNMDSGCVELKLDDGTEIAIDCTAVENLTADNMYERSELLFCLLKLCPKPHIDRRILLRLRTVPALTSAVKNLF